jgi:hypothetical protein
MTSMCRTLSGKNRRRRRHKLLLKMMLAVTRTIQTTMKVLCVLFKYRFLSVCRFKVDLSLMCQMMIHLMILGPV